MRPVSLGIGSLPKTDPGKPLPTPPNTCSSFPAELLTERRTSMGGDPPRYWGESKYILAAETICCRSWGYNRPKKRKTASNVVLQNGKEELEGEGVDKGGRC